MSGWLLDTNVLSELRRPRPAPSVLAFINEKPLESLYVSAMTLAELRFGIEMASDAAKRADLVLWLAHKVRPMFEGRVLEISEDVMFRWRLLVEEGRKVGYTHSAPDLVIAATALEHDLVVVSRDTRAFEHARTPVLDPWRADA